MTTTTVDAYFINTEPTAPTLEGTKFRIGPRQVVHNAGLRVVNLSLSDASLLSGTDLYLPSGSSDTRASAVDFSDVSYFYLNVQSIEVMHITKANGVEVQSFGSMTATDNRSADYVGAHVATGGYRLCPSMASPAGRIGAYVYVNSTCIAPIWKVSTMSNVRAVYTQYGEHAGYTIPDEPSPIPLEQMVTRGYIPSQPSSIDVWKCSTGNKVAHAFKFVSNTPPSGAYTEDFYYIADDGAGGAGPGFVFTYAMLEEDGYTTQEPAVTITGYSRSAAYQSSNNTIAANAIKGIYAQDESGVMSGSVTKDYEITAMKNASAGDVDFSGLVLTCYDGSLRVLNTTSSVITWNNLTARAYNRYRIYLRSDHADYAVPAGATVSACYLRNGATTTRLQSGITLAGYTAYMDDGTPADVGLVPSWDETNMRFDVRNSLAASAITAAYVEFTLVAPTTVSLSSPSAEG